jgi:histidinol phosphatase-like PHP family hydrolase
MHNFHCHTFLSDGVLSPVELIRRCEALGYQTVAITDHLGAGQMEFVLEQLRRDCDLANEHFAITALCGVELTHVPPRAIPILAARAKACGAQIVVVHGETIVEPVPPGTNLAAANCPDVDILAHPGLLTLEEACAARGNGVFIEITSRGGHSLSNGHVAKVVREAGGRWVLNTDAHEPSDLIDEAFAVRVLNGAGLDLDEVERTLLESPQELRRRGECRR